MTPKRRCSVFSLIFIDISFEGKWGRFRFRTAIQRLLRILLPVLLYFGHILNLTNTTVILRNYLWSYLAVQSEKTTSKNQESWLRKYLSHGSLRTQTYFRLSLVSSENKVCKPEPGNDFSDVGILSQSQFSSGSPRTTARGIYCEEYSSFILSRNLIGEGETKVITSQKSFPGSGSQT